MYAAEELNDIGALLISRGEFTMAIDALQQAHEKDQLNPNILCNLGNAYAANKEIGIATACFEKALLLNPKLFEALHSLGFIYLNHGEKLRAIDLLERALAIKDTNDLIINLAFSYRDINPDKAKFYFEKAVKFDPNNIDLHFGLANVYIDLDKNEKAIDYLEKIVKLFPEHAKSWTLLNYEYLNTLQWEKSRNITKKVDAFLTDSLRDPEKAVAEEPQMNLIRVQNAKLNYEVAAKKCKEIENQNSKLQIPNSKKITKGIIRIGYLSDGFRDFPTGHKIVPLFKYHNKKQFEVFVYSYGVNDKSVFRQEIEKYAQNFRDLYGLGDEELYQKIQADNLDILVDLKGHTQNNKLKILARRPAPIQVEWLGFPGTTGAGFIDYAIVDHTVVPKKEERYWSEQLLFMPNSYQIAAPHPRQILRQAQDDKIIFANFNLLYKLDKRTFKSWVKILKAIPNSVLWQIESNNLADKNLVKYFTKAGIKSSRIKLVKRLPKLKHLKRLHKVDIVLDTLQINGHTSTIDALAVGVPVVTMKGKHFASRVSEGILKAANLLKFVAANYEEYEKITIDLASTPGKVNTAKTKLFNSKLFVKDFEKLITKLWKKQ